MTSPLAGQNEGTGVWKHYTVRDGLPDMKIECLFVDSADRLWIGTHDRGAVCFDGSSFQSFIKAEGLVGDGVFSITEDREGALWFGTMGGLFRFDGSDFTVVGAAIGRRYPS